MNESTTQNEVDTNFDIIYQVHVSSSMASKAKTNGVYILLFNLWFFNSNLILKIPLTLVNTTERLSDEDVLDKTGGNTFMD